MKFLIVLTLFIISLPLLAQVKDARIHLSDDCQSSGKCTSIGLNGEWGFVRGQLMPPESVLQSSPMGRIKVPSAWHSQPLNPFNNRWNDAEGVATYFLYLSQAPESWGDAAGISFKSIFTSYKVFFTSLATGQTRVLYDKGWNEQSPLDSEGSLKTQIIGLPDLGGNQDYLLTIHVANKIHAKAGVRGAPVMGLYKPMQTDFYQEKIGRAIFSGAILIIALYHFLIFFQRRSDRSSFWLAVQCIVIACFVSLRSDLWEEFVGPSNLFISFKSRWVYSTNVWGGAIFYLFLINTFPDFRNKFMDRMLLLLNGASLIFVFLPLEYFTRLYINFYLISMALTIIAIVVRTKLIMHKDPTIKIVFGAIVVLACAALHDGLLGAEIINSISLMSYGQVIFLLAQGYVISLRFANAHRIAQRLTEHLSDEVEKQTQEIKSIFHNIHQGIFTIGGEGDLVVQNKSPYLDEVMDGHSEDIETIFQQDTTLKGDQFSQLVSALKSSLNEDVLNFDCNSHLLPLEFTKKLHDGDHLLESSWGIIADKNDVVQKILVTLRDVTEMRMLQDENRLKKIELELIGELLSVQEEGFLSFYKKTKSYLGEIKSLIDDSSRSVSGDDIRISFMNLHTIKGIARTLGLQGISNGVHKIEDQFSDDRHPERLDKSDFLSQIEFLDSELEKYRKTAEDKLGWNTSSEFIRLPKAAIIDGLNGLANNRKSGHLDELDQVRASLMDLEQQLEGYSGALLEQQILNASSGIGSIARSLGKESPKIEVTGVPVMLSEAGIDLLQDLLSHLFRNSVDHGLEDPEKRTRHQKTPVGSISVKSAVVDGKWTLLFSDDGQGLNIEQIKAKAEESSGESLDQASEADIAAKIFDFGVSTAQNITDISGRGVGMDAVRSFLVSKGGQIDILLATDKNSYGHYNFEFLITFPDDYWWEALSKPA